MPMSAPTDENAMTEMPMRRTTEAQSTLPTRDMDEKLRRLPGNTAITAPIRAKALTEPLRSLRPLRDRNWSI